ncbi:hypothetical protein [Providencia sp. PROV075]|uniref:hypothetical protein n=1 Tax=Providencia sp. PROV075 TaxID=2949797 RepID=UPI002349668F|nr:hypothetical protein [Providencia sp. PROV075]
MIILLIILVPAVPFFCLLKKRKWKFWLDESSLHVQPLFWFLVFLPLIISGITWVLVAQDYELDVSTRGYSRLMENAKFPFLILALSPILGAFATSAHRSLQTDAQIKATKKQIKITEEKNKIDLFFNTRKSIFERFLYISSHYNEKIEWPMSLYSNFLIENNNSIYINNKMVDSFLSKLDKHFFSYDILRSFHWCSDGIYENVNFEKINEISLESEDFIGVKIEELGLSENDYNLCMKLNKNINIVNDINLFRNEILKTLCIGVENKNVFLDIYKQYQTNLINAKNEFDYILTEDDFNERYANGSYDGDIPTGFQSDYIDIVVTDIYYKFIWEIIKEINNTIWLIIEVFEIISLEVSALETLPILQKYIDYCNETLNELENFGANIDSY